MTVAAAMSTQTATPMMMAGAIAGPMVGGALIPVLGYGWLYLVDTLTLFATLTAVWRLPALPVAMVPGHTGVQSVPELRRNILDVTLDRVLAALPSSLAGGSCRVCLFLRGW